jgi:hypothetical protein
VEGAAGLAGWVDAEFRTPTWAEALPYRRFGAVGSTTALHWLSPPEFERAYQRSFGLLRKGGTLLNDARATVGYKNETVRQLAPETMNRARRCVGASLRPGSFCL